MRGARRWRHRSKQQGRFSDFLAALRRRLQGVLGLPWPSNRGTGRGHRWWVRRCRYSAVSVNVGCEARGSSWLWIDCRLLLMDGCAGWLYAMFKDSRCVREYFAEVGQLGKGRFLEVVWHLALQCCVEVWDVAMTASPGVTVGLEMYLCL